MRGEDIIKLIFCFITHLKYMKPFDEGIGNLTEKPFGMTN